MPTTTPNSDWLVDQLSPDLREWLLESAERGNTYRTQVDGAWIEQPYPLSQRRPQVGWNWNALPTLEDLTWTNGESFHMTASDASILSLQPEGALITAAELDRARFLRGASSVPPENYDSLNPPGPTPLQEALSWLSTGERSLLDAIGNQPTPSASNTRWIALLGLAAFLWWKFGRR